MRILVLVLALLASPALAENRFVPQSKQEITMSFAPLVKRTAPAVVNVYAKTVVQQPQGNSPFDDPFFKKFFGLEGQAGRPRERVGSSLGSGVIVDSSGIIVTNNHVIKNGTDIRVAIRAG